MPALPLVTALGYAVISGVILLAVLVYTIIKLRKQVKKAEKREKKKKYNKD